MKKSKLFYVGIIDRKQSGTYCIYVCDSSMSHLEDSFSKFLNELPLRKNHWRAAVKHYEKYNLYDYFYKIAVEQVLACSCGPDMCHNVVSEGLGNSEYPIDKNKKEIKELAKSLLSFSMEKDEKGDFKVERF